MQYNHLSNDPIYPCVFIRKSKFRLAIIVIYVDNVNVIGTFEELLKTIEYLKIEFEMKDTRKIKYCLDLQIEYKTNRMFIHESAYVQKILKYLHINNVHPLSTHVVVRSFNLTKNPFPLYQAQYIIADIAFSMNLLVRFNSTLTQ